MAERVSIFSSKIIIGGIGFDNNDEQPFSTSNSENVDRKKALELGADDYIIKPFEMQTLLTMAKKWIKSGSVRHKQTIEKEII